MRTKSFSSTRRSFLRGAGVTMALPFLEAFSPGGRALAQTAKTGALGPNGEPVRFATFFMPNGVNRKEWTPKSGALGELPRILKPLEALKGDINVISGINNIEGGHTRGTAGFLTGILPLKTERPSEVNVYSATLDQVIGQALKESSVFPSLELGLGGPADGVNMMGTTHLYTNTLSWKDGKTPIPYENNPQRAFDRLFKSVATTNDRGSSAATKAVMPDPSVVDAVLEDAKFLQKKLGREDKTKLDEYFTAVREVEQRIAQQKAVVGLKITEDVLRDILRVKGDVRDHMRGQEDGTFQSRPNIPTPEYGRLMMDILALAFWSNSTRSATICFGNGVAGGGNMSFIDGVNGGHHQISHHGYKKEPLEEFTLINTFYMEQYAYLLDRLKGMKEGSSNVLENSVVLFGSNISEGQNHGGKNVPIILSGNAGGRMKTGNHIEAKGQPIGDLHRSILGLMEVNARFGEGNGTVRGI